VATAGRHDFSRQDHHLEHHSYALTLEGRPQRGKTQGSLPSAYCFFTIMDSIIAYVEQFEYWSGVQESQVAHGVEFN
jgi:hypothetical protein